MPERSSSVTFGFNTMLVVQVCAPVVPAASMVPPVLGKRAWQLMTLAPKSEVKSEPLQFMVVT